MTPSDPPIPVRVLTPAHVHRLIETWCTALERRGPAAELLPHLANGLLLQLPDRTVRGTDEFARWYRRQHDHAESVAVLSAAAAGRIDVRIATPVHAEVTISPWLPGHAPQNWWVVLRDGSARIRSISVRGGAAVPRPEPPAGPEPAARVPARIPALSPA
ncbi:hypothetical protein KDK95_32605 [Actinospica sp. MGRD01-02]|uniref:Uncharacterized protein n=1 Tax=Actinospica acidithermotolerans TaxID=2828514 RepID=A0A941EGK7_9ACTN|nr:hypothetical protein [Actinospica acidithermotolerans]MBR7831092.1 hypothetical protein [Actinospica acidithermotolerans]